MNYSPLRYPGGKNKISKFVELLIMKNELSDCTYIEPFAGGAGIALSLLMNGVANKIIINDLSNAVYSFWYSVLNNTDELCRLIYDTPVTVHEWRRQKSIYKININSLELGFATFFLNRTNKSGILNGGIIGGYTQTGEWKIDARYNKKELIQRVQKIALHQKKISVHNLDCIELVNRVISRQKSKTFIYFDPPYFEKGKRLYENYYKANDHENLANIITKKVKKPWLMTYDNVEEIANYYSGFSINKYELNYSAAKIKRGTELMICSNNIILPTISDMNKAKVKFSYSNL
jgi:DNA adenine methylase